MTLCRGQQSVWGQVQDREGDGKATAARRGLWAPGVKSGDILPCLGTLGPAHSTGDTSFSPRVGAWGHPLGTSGSPSDPGVLPLPHSPGLVP